VELILELLYLLSVVNQNKIGCTHLERFGLLIFTGGDDGYFVAHCNSQPQPHLTEPSKTCDGDLFAAAQSIGLLERVPQRDSCTENRASLFQGLLGRDRNCKSPIDHKLFSVASLGVSFSISLSMQIVLDFCGVGMGEPSAFAHLFMPFFAIGAVEA